MSIIEAGAHKTKLLSGDILVEQWQSLWDGLSEELKQEYGQEGLQKGTCMKPREEIEDITWPRGDTKFLFEC